jgi:hypothetical protein
MGRRGVAPSATISLPDAAAVTPAHRGSGAGATAAGALTSRPRRFCANLRELEVGLWPFVVQEGVEPTNNHAERLRRGLLWRQNAFGCHREGGLPLRGADADGGADAAVARGVCAGLSAGGVGGPSERTPRTSAALSRLNGYAPWWPIARDSQPPSYSQPTERSRHEVPTALTALRLHRADPETPWGIPRSVVIQGSPRRKGRGPFSFSCRSTHRSM